MESAAGVGERPAGRNYSYVAAHRRRGWWQHRSRRVAVAWRSGAARRRYSWVAPAHGFRRVRRARAGVRTTMSLKVLILGVNGFIGRSLTERILRDTDWD